MCEHCGDGPACVVCGRSDDPRDGYRDSDRPGADPDPPRLYVAALRIARHLRAVGLTHPAAVREGRQLAREVNRWRALVRSYFAARRQGCEPGAALEIAWAVLGITPAARPVVPAGWDHL